MKNPTEEPITDVRSVLHLDTMLLAKPSAMSGLQLKQSGGSEGLKPQREGPGQSNASCGPPFSVSRRVPANSSRISNSDSMTLRSNEPVRAASFAPSHDRH